MIAFFVAGKAETKGSARPYTIRRPDGGVGARVTNDNPRAKSWAATIGGVARLVYRGQALAGPMHVILDFRMQRPKSHYTKKGLRPTAPAYCPKKPDIDKIARCALDALTGIVYVDDAQVVTLTATKHYADGPAGVMFTMTEGTK